MGEVSAQIKSALSLSDVIEFYTGEHLHKGKISCPFHREKTASFTVYPNNTFYCFGCGVSGDVITFVMKLFNLSFGQAIVRLNVDFGLMLPSAGCVDKAAAKEAKKRIEAEKNEREKHRCETIKKYWDLFDEVLCMENVIRFCRPKNIDEAPHPMFIYSLQNLQDKKYRLALAYDERRMLNE